MSDLVKLRDGMRGFTRDLGWEKYHDPKSLILALIGEVGELSELFQWVPAGEARQAGTRGELHERAKEEIADVLLYLVRLADVLGVDLAEAGRQKLEKASLKHTPGEHPDRYRLPSSTTEPAE